MRKWINLLNELSIGDFGGGDEPDGREMVEVNGICWYLQNEDMDEIYHPDLPTEVTLAIDLPRDAAQGTVEMVVQSELDHRFGDKHNASSLISDYRFI